MGLETRRTGARDPEREWRLWRARRLRWVREPSGPLELTGTHWVETETVVPDVAGVFVPEEGGVRVKATASDGVEVDGSLVDGSVFLAPGDDALVDGVRLVVLVRDGVAAVRVYDALAPARSAFEGIEVFDYDPHWVLPASFTPYERDRVEAVDTADGARRGLALAGDVTFELPGGRRAALAVARAESGLSAVFSDTSGGNAGGDGPSFGFRSLALPSPDPQGHTVADFNRAYLPPCAFGTGFLCPLPPSGNTLPVKVPAGERRVLWAEQTD